MYLAGAMPVEMRRAHDELPAARRHERGDVHAGPRSRRRRCTDVGVAERDASVIGITTDTGDDA